MALQIHVHVMHPFTLKDKSISCFLFVCWISNRLPLRFLFVKRQNNLNENRVECILAAAFSIQQREKIKEIKRKRLNDVQCATVRCCRQCAIEFVFYRFAAASNELHSLFHRVFEKKKKKEEKMTIFLFLFLFRSLVLLAHEIQNTNTIVQFQ